MEFDVKLSKSKKAIYSILVEALCGIIIIGTMYLLEELMKKDNDIDIFWAIAIPIICVICFSLMWYLLNNVFIRVYMNDQGNIVISRAIFFNEEIRLSDVKKWKTRDVYSFERAERKIVARWVVLYYSNKEIKVIKPLHDDADKLESFLEKRLRNKKERIII